MIKMKLKQKLAIVICIIVAIIICSGIGLAVYMNNISQQELQVSTTNNEISKEDEAILDVEEIVTEENVQEINEEEAIPQQEEIKEEVKEDVKEETSKENKTTTTKKTNTTQTQTEIPYYIKINYKQNVVTVYAKDESGNYTKPVKAMVCSCGTATPKSGTYSISDKYKWGKLFRWSVWAILYKNSKKYIIPFCAIFNTWR